MLFHSMVLAFSPILPLETGTTQALLAALGWLLPIGVLLIAASGMRKEEAREATLTFLIAAGVTAALYFAYGFALQFGGVGIRYRTQGLSGLVWLWTPLDLKWGTGWGMAGIRGFGLLPPASTPEAYLLFLAFLPRAVTAAMIPLLLLRHRAPLWASIGGAILSGGVLYPLMGCWLWGDGWLSNLGHDLGLGHGFVDAAGSSLFLMAGAVSLAAMQAILPRKAAPHDGAELPPVHLPLLAGLGAAMVLVGGTGWTLANPLLGGVSPTLAALNGILSALAGALLPSLYLWFVRGGSDPLMASRGLVAGWVAGAASFCFVPPWAAMTIGGIAGILVPLVTYLVDRVARWDDPVGAVSTFLVPGAWGLVALGIFADGASGVGWNGVGAESYMGVPGQGVSGLLVAFGNKPDWPGQELAQIVGGSTVLLLAIFLGLLIFGVGAWAGSKSLDVETPSGKS